MLVEDIIYEYEGERLKILQYLNDVLVNEYGLFSKVKYKAPFYYGKSWICYLSIKKDAVELAFTRGNELSNTQGILEHHDRKQVAGITYGSLNEVDKYVLDEILLEAITLDDNVPYKSKRTKK